MASTKEMLEDDLNQLMTDTAQWYDRHGYLTRLKLLYKDHLAMSNAELDRTTSVMDLLQDLTASGSLSLSNLAILYDTVKITKQFGFKSKVKNQPPEVIKDHKVLMIKTYRQRLFQLGTELNRDEVSTLDSLHNNPVKRYQDSWSLIMDFEHRGIIDEDMKKMERFLTDLKANQMNWALRILVDDLHESVMETSSSNIEECNLTPTDKGETVMKPSSSNSEENKLSPADKGANIHVTLMQRMRGISFFKPSKIKRGHSRKKRQSLQATPTADVQFHGTILPPTSFNSEEKKHHQMSPKYKAIKMFLKEELQELYKHMNLMGTAVFGEEHKVDIADVFTDLTLLQSTKQKHVDQATRLNEAKPTCLKEVLSITKSKRSCKVQITGKGGMGKTTLLRYIAYNWAKGKDDTFSDKVLFLINIRDIELGKTIIDSIVDQIDLDRFANHMKKITKFKGDSVDLIENFLTENEDEIVLLLDGLDELKKGAKNPLNLLNFRSNNNNTILITSRPSLNITTFVENCDVHVQVNGFSKESKKIYIEKYFKNNPELGKKLITKLDLKPPYTYRWQFENKTVHLAELCSSPLLLLIICSMCEQTTSSISMADEILPITMSDFFKEFICCTLNQHTKVEENKIAEIREIQNPYRKAILALGQCMFNGLTKNKLYIYKNEFDGMIDKDTVELALKLGFVYKKSCSIKTDRKAIFAPPHKLVSEALAGLYLANACLSNEMNEEECKRMLLNPYLHMTIIFTIKFLGKDAGKIIKHWLKVKTAANYYSLVKYFSYVKPEHEIHVVHKLPNISSDAVCEMFKNVLYYDDLDNQKAKQQFENKHLVQLMNICFERFKGDPRSVVDTLLKIIEAKDIKPTKTFCSMLVHIYIIIHGLMGDHYIDDDDCRLFELHSLLEDSEIDTLSAEMDSFQFKYRFRNIHFTTSTNPKFLIHLLTFSSSNLCLNFKPGSITGDVLNHVIVQVNDISLEIQHIKLSDNDLSNISVDSLTMLMNITQYCINLNNCQLSGAVFNALFKEQSKVLPNDIRLYLEGNDLSDIDGVSLSKLVNLLDSEFKWSDYNLSVDNLESLADACHEHGCMLAWTKLVLDGLHLAAIKRSKLAFLLQFSPKLCKLDLVNCNLSGTIIRDLLEECEVNKVVLNPGMLNLKDNDLSDIDVVSLSKLVNLMNYNYESFIWSDYSLSVGNLESLADACHEHGHKLSWNRLHLCGLHLAEIKVSKLAWLLQFSPKLCKLYLGNCNLSGTIIRELLKECEVNKVLTSGMLDLKGNDLSDIDGVSLCKLVNLICNSSSDYRSMYDYELYNYEPYGHEPDGHEPDGHEPDGHEPDGHEPDGHEPDGHEPDGHEPYGHEPYGHEPYGHEPYGHVPYGHEPYGHEPYGHEPYGHEPYGHEPYGHEPYGHEPYGHEPYGHEPYGHVPYGHEPYGHEPDGHEPDGYESYGYESYGYEPFIWCYYNLSVDNLESLADACHEHGCMLTWENLVLSGVHLAAINVSKLAWLLQFSPELCKLDLVNCNLSGTIIRDLLVECEVKKVTLKPDMLRLEGNDLSGIDGVSLSKLVNLMDYNYESFKWSDYSFSVGNLESLTDACQEHGRMLTWKHLDLSGLHLAEIRVSKLAWLLQFSPELCKLDLVNCNLSGTIIRDLLKECEVNKVVLEPGMLDLRGNDLSGVSISKLMNLIYCDDLFKWRDYNLSIDNVMDIDNSTVYMESFKCITFI